MSDPNSVGSWQWVETLPTWVQIIITAVTGITFALLYFINYVKRKDSTQSDLILAGGTISGPIPTGALVEALQTTNAMLRNLTVVIEKHANYDDKLGQTLKELVKVTEKQNQILQELANELEIQRRIADFRRKT